MECIIDAILARIIRSKSSNAASNTITELLVQWRDGDAAALDRLIPLVYRELRRMASYYMRRRRPGDTLQTSALINEAYLRLAEHKNMRWQNRSHFFAVASQAMRRILVDYARAKHAVKRGGQDVKVALDEIAELGDQRAAELIALDDALRELSTFDARKSQIVEMRYFGGLSVEETAQVLSVSPVTINREWRAAKLWLLRSMTGEAQN